MSKTEIETEFRAMTQAERQKTAELLGSIIRENDPEYQAELDESGGMERGQKAADANSAAASHECWRKDDERLPFPRRRRTVPTRRAARFGINERAASRQQNPEA